MVLHNRYIIFTSKYQLIVSLIVFSAFLHKAFVVKQSVLKLYYAVQNSN